ncbi:MAG: hypothetical protein IKC06_01420 [Clostridia bacterium]|nr:hypothetical protein [Clostridia bacterium]
MSPTIQMLITQLKYQTTDRSYQMPEEWQGNIKAIVSITALTTEPKPTPPSSTN